MRSFTLYNNEKRGWLYSVEYQISFFAGKDIYTLAKHN